MLIESFKTDLSISQVLFTRASSLNSKLRSKLDLKNRIQDRHHVNSYEEVSGKKVKRSTGKLRKLKYHVNEKYKSLLLKDLN